MKKSIFTLFLITSLLLTLKSYAQQGGGMWIPNQLNEKEMKQMGMKIPAKQIFDNKNPSIKDAIAHFGGGCTSEVISPQGLLLTNHHCGYGQIQAHSTVENDLLENGFWAENYSKELPNEGLTATFIIDIIDITKEILKNVTDNMSERQRQGLITSNSDKITQSLPKESYQNIMVKSFYNENQFFAFITETYEDIRLVGTPPSSIGKFGSDTDNWVWPRHTGDFSIFRIYADKNNRPAKYSKDNIPYKPKYYLPISIKNKREDDFSFVYGFPGRTQEYLPSDAIIETIETINPARISLRDATLKILDEKMRTDQETKIKYASKYASIANGWKKWIGESQGLKKSNAIQKKKEYEQEFNKYLDMNPDAKSKYGNILPIFNEIYKENEKYTKANTYFNEVFYLNSETFKMAILLLNLLETNSSEFEISKQKTIERISGIYKNYDADLDGKVSAKLLSLYSLNIEPRFQTAGHENYERLTSSQNFIDRLWGNSIISGKKSNLVNFISNSKKEELSHKLYNDPIIKFVNSYFDVYKNKIYPQYNQSQTKLDSLQRLYMKAQLEAFPDKKFFPDANSTLRVSYGKIDGYQPKDAVHYSPYTSLEGVLEKYIPGDYEFNVPEKLIDLYKQKDYGVYGTNGKLSVNYIASNHTTGGNSGSPAFDAKGNLVGLNFDRVWEGTMSDLNYDPAICRNIMVDIRYVLFLIEKYAGANHLIKEMNIIK